MKDEKDIKLEIENQKTDKVTFTTFLWSIVSRLTLARKYEKQQRVKLQNPETLRHIELWCGHKIQQDDKVWLMINKIKDFMGGPRFAYDYAMSDQLYRIITQEKTLFDLIKNEKLKIHEVICKGKSHINTPYHCYL